ncbi:hypothetical protein NQ317_005064 [Molorchus minor]|uniref:Uncharacterized protein n=1 Tax=Molorchus minor TaxID=1323400 RepID=A0ABQ9JXX5_9CUCU|nr:hypothetical protein NQ317_005064 [Molorchus minor]
MGQKKLLLKRMRVLVLLLVIHGAAPSSISNEDGMTDNEISELQFLNRSVDPCDDFYEFACGNFKTSYPLRDGVTTIDQFTILEDKLLELTSAILSSGDAPEDPVALKKARAAYQACVDIDYVDSMMNPEVTVVAEERGFPLVQHHDEREAVPFGWNEIGEAVSKYGIPMIFSLEAYSDLSNASNNLIRLYADPIANPSLFRPHEEATYEQVLEKSFQEFSERDDSKRIRSSLAPFDIFLRKMALKIRRAIGSHISEDKIIENIETMANFMRGVYQGGYIPTNVTIENFSGMSITLKELNAWTKRHFGDKIEIDWVEYLGRVFANSGVHIDDDTQVLTPNGLPQLIYGILNWVSMNEQETVKNFVLMRVFLYMAPDSDAETRAVFEEYYKGLNLKTIPRTSYCTRKIVDSVGTASLSFAVAYEYQLRHFNVNQLTKALQMIRDLQSSFMEIIDEATWMDEESKTVAVQKVENMVTLLGYPDFADNKTLLDRFYENVRICKWDNYGNSKRIRAFKQAYQISQVANRDRTFWDKSPFEVNAYYNRPNNRIIFPVAVLNPVFFGSNSSILDYGRIGSVIGHEITHGFDAQGQIYDQDGVMRQWWSTTTKEAFSNRTQCFIEQYSKYFIPEIDAYVNSSLTLNENIADNGGARESYRAMNKLRVRMGSDLKTEEFSAEQMFFIGYGTMWCNNPSTEYLQSMQVGAHAPSKWRVNGVLSNMEEFSEAFNCASGSNMNPVDKCRLW